MPPPIRISVLVVFLGLFGVKGYPKEADCGGVDFLREDRLAEVLTLGPNSNEIFDMSLDTTETAVVVVTRLDVVGRRHIRGRHRRLQQAFEDAVLNELSCSGDADGDGIAFQILDDDDNHNDDGIGCDLQDDDAQTSDHNRGGLSHFFEVRVLDANSGEVSSKTPKRHDEEAVTLASRGQQGTCAHPAQIEIAGVEGEGDLEVSVVYMGRNPDIWNAAAVSFENAKTIEEGNLDWCGNVNLLKESKGSCTASMSTPKWKIWLNPKDKFLLTAHFYGHEDVSETHALTVSLVLYSDRGVTKVTTLLDEPIIGREVHCAEYSHKDSASGWYYLELIRENRHVYEYGIAFEIKRKCRDHRKKKFTMPRDLKTCGWLQGLNSDSRSRHCTKSRSNADVACPKTCGHCTSCPDDHPSTTFYRQQEKCKALPKDQASLQEICPSTDAGGICLESCSKCPTPIPL